MWLGGSSTLYTKAVTAVHIYATRVDILYLVRDLSRNSACHASPDVVAAAQL
jgi:hypothetical protein